MFCFVHFFFWGPFFVGLFLSSVLFFVVFSFLVFVFLKLGFHFQSARGQISFLGEEMQHDFDEFVKSHDSKFTATWV